MSQNIKKIDIKDLLKKFTLNNTNSYSTEKGEVNKTNPHIENLNTDSSQFEADGLLEDIHDFFFPPSIQEKLDEIEITPDELGEMIHYDSLTIDDIESITDCDSKGEMKKIVINDDEGPIEVLLVKENGEYIVSSINLGDGITIQCNLSESKEQSIRDSIGLSDDVEINGYSKLEIKGQRVPVYWTGDNFSLSQARDIMLFIKEGLNLYPSNVLIRVLGRSHFKGFFLGLACDVPLDGMPQDGWSGVTWNDEFIYLNEKTDILSLESGEIPHEFAHLLDYILNDPKKIFDNFSEEDREMMHLFSMYRKQFQQAFDDRIGYNSEKCPEGIPYYTEFFAELVSVYLRYPEELESLFPDLYEYVDEIIKNV